MAEAVGTLLKFTRYHISVDLIKFKNSSSPTRLEE